MTQLEDKKGNSGQKHINFGRKLAAVGRLFVLYENTLDLSESLG
jgi:hypothetical protein